MRILGLFRQRQEAPAHSEDDLHLIMGQLLAEKDKLRAIYNKMGRSNGHNDKAERQFALGIAILQLQGVIRDLGDLAEWKPC